MFTWISTTEADGADDATQAVLTVVSACRLPGMTLSSLLVPSSLVLLAAVCTTGLACGTSTEPAVTTEVDVETFCSTLKGCTESGGYREQDCAEEEGELRTKSERAECLQHYETYFACAAKAGLACAPDPYDPVEAQCEESMRARNRCVSDHWQKVCHAARSASWRRLEECGLTTGPEPDWSDDQGGTVPTGCSEQLALDVQQEAECRAVTDCAAMDADRCVCFPSRPDGTTCIDNRDGGAR